MERLKRLYRRLQPFMRRAAADPMRPRLGLYAAAGAYDLLFCLGPLTALLLSLLPFTAITEAELQAALARLSPPALVDLTRSLAGSFYARPAGALGLSLAAELWGAARLLSRIVRTLRELNGARGAGYLKSRLLGAALTLLLLAAILLCLTMMLFGGRVCQALETRRPALAPAARVLLFARPLVLAGILTAGNTLLYRSPPGHQRALPGAALAAAIWLAFTRLYSLALERFGLFGVYGSIAAVIVTLYWAYCSLYILYLGAWFNRLLPPHPGPSPRGHLRGRPALASAGGSSFRP